MHNNDAAMTGYYLDIVALLCEVTDGSRLRAVRRAPSPGAPHPRRDAARFAFEHARAHVFHSRLQAFETRCHMY
jgi:hypothetical protein